MQSVKTDRQRQTRCFSFSQHNKNQKSGSREELTNDQLIWFSFYMTDCWSCIFQSIIKKDNDKSWKCSSVNRNRKWRQRKDACVAHKLRWNWAKCSWLGCICSCMWCDSHPLHCHVNVNIYICGICLDWQWSLESELWIEMMLVCYKEESSLKV